MWVTYRLLQLGAGAGLTSERAPARKARLPFDFEHSSLRAGIESNADLGAERAELAAERFSELAARQAQRSWPYSWLLDYRQAAK